MHHHIRQVCREHGNVVKQCRCPAPKEDQPVDCPPTCPGRAAAPSAAKGEALRPPKIPRTNGQVLEDVTALVEGVLDGTRPYFSKYGDRPIDLFARDLRRILNRETTYADLG